MATADTTTPTVPASPVAPTPPATGDAALITVELPTTTGNTTTTAATAPAAPVTPAVAIDSNPYGSATLLKHEWDNTPIIRYEPVSIIFLSGDYASQQIDLGYNLKESSEEQKATWGEIASRGVRPGLEFKGLTNRSFSMAFEFWSNTQDIRQLAENLSHLQEITGADKNPPLLSLQIGKTVITPVICESFSAKYDNPFPKQAGFRHATVTLAFKLMGGANTKHATGAALGATPLSDYAKALSAAQKRKLGEVTRAVQLLAPCLGNEGSDAISSLVENNKINDPAAIAALPPRTLVNLAVSGLSSTILSDPAVSAKLKTSLASLLAQAEPGGNPAQFDQLTQSLLSGKPDGLSGVVIVPDSTGATPFQSMSTDLATILTAIQNQDLGIDSQIFDRNANPTARDRLNGIANCGLTLKQSGGITGGAPNTAVTPSKEQLENNTKMSQINQLLGLKPSFTDFIAKLQLPPDTKPEFVTCLIGSVPIADFAHFNTEVARCSEGLISGSGLWEKFKVT